MSKISLVMIVKNEEEYLGRCLNSIYSHVDEIIIVDTGSSDKTINIAESYGANVYHYEWTNDFAQARNYALEKSSSEWNIVLDADEYITSNIESLKEFIEKNKEKNVIGKVIINSKTISDGEIKYTRSLVSRILPKGVYFTGRIHEQVNIDFPRKNTEIEIHHDGYLLSNKTDRNLPLLLLELKEDENDGYILYQIAKQYSLQNKYELALNFYRKSYENTSYSDNYFALMIVDYLYSINSSKQFDLGLNLIKKIQNYLINSTDFHFVCALFYMELVFSDINKYIQYFHNIEHEYMKCLEIGERNNTDCVVGTGSFLAQYNLGTFYEASNQIEKAKMCYMKAIEHGYQKAEERLKMLKN
ncbi:glycosyltransferase family 2 protein [Gottfriedia solisilvae]|uniref:Glycosyltransferase 2-like domain-containing protein n=1 Tax=Gottfriedia solisilvae TaxID=1516104 RepID=A0A8J3APN8_9BACI|nr:glycosyltransferase family 2 protein [Gottfriedia solisilvae]GGI16509.1 hypothetical protein GCM10007380_33320 [Gottfriedia solisilvae]